MVLLISFLLLVACAGLLLEVSTHTANVTDATAEQQAYIAAESGIQSALNILRNADDIDFKKAVTPLKSNFDGDASTTARLSRWLNYAPAPYNDRIILGNGIGGSTYGNSTGYAYDVTLTDPDKTDTFISYTTIATIDGGGSSIKIDGSSAADYATIEFKPPDESPKTIDVSSGAANDALLGEFKVTMENQGATLLEDLRFNIRLDMTFPYEATRIIRGTIKSGRLLKNQLIDIKIDFDTKGYELMGSMITLKTDPVDFVSETAKVECSWTQAEPIRLIIKSVGYGPRGARKELEAVVRKNFFDGLSAPSTLNMIGKSGPDFYFRSGSSNRVTYSGEDTDSTLVVPPIGVTNTSNLDEVNKDIVGNNTKVYPITNPPVVDITDELPHWLESAENLDNVIQALKNVAKSSGRYFPAGQIPDKFGDYANATGITFVEGDIKIDNPKSGGGILVVTGKLDLKGDINFKGLIIVTGAGGLERSGGGGGSLMGNVIVAPYNPNDLLAGYKSPRYTITGGGNSTMTYNSSSLANGLTAVSNFVLGVAEK